MTTDYFLKRKTCRFFLDKKIPQKMLEDIINKAMKAPTCGNMQLYTVIVTEEEERLKKLSAFHYNQPAASTAPMILTICADFNRFTRWCEYKDADAGYDNFHSFMMALTDALILTQQIVTVAEMEGLGTCYLGTVNYNAEQISEFLELPDLVVPVASISIGFPEKEGEETSRLPIKAIIHNETYRKDDREEILDYYKTEEENPANKKFIEENGKQNLAQVFAEVRYPRDVNENISKSYSKLLKDKKFI